jgi:hypothetical protein
MAAVPLKFCMHFICLPVNQHTRHVVAAYINVCVHVCNILNFSLTLSFLCPNIFLWSLVSNACGSGSLNVWYCCRHTCKITYISSWASFLVRVLHLYYLYLECSWLPYNNFLSFFKQFPAFIESVSLSAPSQTSAIGNSVPAHADKPLHSLHLSPNTQLHSYKIRHSKRPLNFVQEIMLWTNCCHHTKVNILISVSCFNYHVYVTLSYI